MKHLKALTLPIFLLLFAGPTGYSSPKPVAKLPEENIIRIVSGKVYDESDLSKQVFTFSRIEKIVGSERIVDVSFKDSNDVEALHEKLIYDKDTDFRKFKTYEFNRFQTKERALMKPEGEKLIFKYWDEDGDEKSDDEDYTDTVVHRDYLVPYVRKHWDLLMKGEKVKARMALPDRAETIGFNIFKTGESEISGKKAVKLVLRPSSPFIAMVARDTFFYLEQDGEHRILRADGRTPVLKNVGGKLKNMHGRIEFEYVR